ncbi:MULTISPECIES: HEAT repeat domain-containing protein [unclassified Pseudomonas]|jgi:HEAT repeat protein|uniref:HEAT repeat domain-containing protein n=1 Tax=unclassified Pseudomonas TaxID=196821 RepID=UPI0009F33D89|nr:MULTISPECIES: HEAT repeat domain-containing protein [unclassified Pseudomonas]QOF83071.1 HEAT repeat domain-containing protein [Pseudomonas sp. ADPe]
MANFEDVVKELITTLEKDGHPDARAGAALGLGHCGGPGALSALRKAMTTDGTAAVRGAAAKAIGQLLSRAQAADLIG